MARGNSYASRKVKKSKDSDYINTLRKEAPETLRAPKRSEFVNGTSYAKAALRYGVKGNWATEEPKPKIKPVSKPFVPTYGGKVGGKMSNGAGWGGELKAKKDPMSMLKRGMQGKSK